MIEQFIKQANLSPYEDLDDTYVVHVRELEKFAELVLYAGQNLGVFDKTDIHGIYDVEMPEPDTHCFDTDAQQDVWSYSLGQLKEFIATRDAVINGLRYKLAYKDAKVKMLEEE